MVKKGVSALPVINVPKQIEEDLKEIAQHKGLRVTDIRRRAYAFYLNEKNKERGKKEKKYL